MQGEVFSVAKKTNSMDTQVRTDTPLSVCHMRQFATTARVTTFRFSQLCSFVPVYYILHFEGVLPSTLELLNALRQYLND